MRRVSFIMALAGFVLMLFVSQAGAAVDQSVIERGKYLARAADCFMCHTAEDGAPYAGGRPLHTPFGTIYSTNITPHETGIADYSADEFYHLLHTGEAPGGRQIYPAMPYTSYHLLTREDSNAIYHYLMSLEPIDNVAPDSELSFPYNQRWGLVFWNLLFADDDVYQPDPQHSQAWNRGRYLATALGHCGQCHTSRGFMGAMNADAYLAGSQLGRIWPPNITAQALARRGWTPQQLKSYLKAGLSQLGAANGEMFPAVMHGTHYLTDADINALVTYLLAGVEVDGAATGKATKTTAVPVGEPGPGRSTYINRCAGCHQADGSGIHNVNVALASSTTLQLKNPHNLIAVILDGIPLQDFPGYARMQTMPSYARQLDNQEMADLVNYLRTTWGSRPGQVTPEDIAAVRAEPAPS